MSRHRIDYGQIVQDMLERTGGNQTALAERLGVKQPTISRWISGDQEPEKINHDRILHEARELGIARVEHLGANPVPVGSSRRTRRRDRVHRARRPPAASSTASVFGDTRASDLARRARRSRSDRRGQIGPRGEVELRADGELGDATMPPAGRRTYMVALVVRADAALGAPIDRDWLIYYENRREPPTPGLIGRPCVVGLPDGRILVCRIAAAATDGRYHLIGITDAALIPDQIVDWAAPIAWIAPD